jgi:hypothetical protein
MMLLFGVVLQNMALAHLGASVVVLLNIGRFFVGLANLVVIPFRDGIIQGILFLIPPFTFFYLAKHWKKVRKPTRRVVGPALTIGLVILLYTFIPSLSEGRSATGPLEQDLKQLGDQAKQLSEQAEDELRQFEGRSRKEARAPKHE